MRLTSININSTKFTKAYTSGDASALNFFKYDWKSQTSFEKRAKYLLAHSNYQKKEICSAIRDYMRPLGLHEATETNIMHLSGNGLVVIGGQQAGLLTGPMYTISKIISLIELARQQTKKLGVPVIPVFWIAGEDHDYDEVNRVFVKDGHRLVEHVYPQKITKKTMISDVRLETDIAQKWVLEIMQSLGETVHSKEIIRLLNKAIDDSQTFTQFFARLIHHLFADTGLLLVDSGDKNFRKLGKSAFLSIFSHSKKISEAVLSTQTHLLKLGFSPLIETSLDNVNLFYYDPKIRERQLLLHKFKTDEIKLKGSKTFFSSQKVTEIIEKHPENFSANVVARPLVQEKLFPVLAFVGGPGELAYWAELSEAFLVLDEEMPPLVPRFGFTIVERQIQKRMDSLNLSLKKVLEEGCSKECDHAIKTKLDPGFLGMYDDLLHTVITKHTAWENVAQNNLQLTKLFANNRKRLIGELDWMKQKIEHDHLRNHQDVKSKYEDIENSLYPKSGMQERTLNIFYFLNKYGYDWLKFLLKAPLEQAERHYLLHL